MKLLVHWVLVACQVDNCETATRDRKASFKSDDNLKLSKEMGASEAGFVPMKEFGKDSARQQHTEWQRQTKAAIDSHRQTEAGRAAKR